MARTTPQLRLLNPTTGEVPQETCPSCVEMAVEHEMLGREMKGYRLRQARLEAELRNLQMVEPEAVDVHDVLSHWARRMVEEGWWSRKPTFSHGSVRWTTVRALMKKSKTYDVPYLRLAVEGACLQPKSQTRREWMDATSIFRNEANVERHFERAQDPRLERVLQARTIPEELFALDLTDLCRRCDCGCLKVVHTLPDPAREGREPCRRCSCEDFSDTNTRADEWLARQRS